MTVPTILHETKTRLRVAAPPGADLGALQAGLAAARGVQAVRVNAALRCVVVQHDGQAPTRAAVLRRLAEPAAPAPRRRGVHSNGRRVDVSWAPSALAASVPLLPHAWRGGAALGAVAARLATRPERLRTDAPAALLDAASLASLAVNGQSVAVSASLLLREFSEHLSGRLVRQADQLLDRLVPTEAHRYSALRDPAEDSAWSWWPLRALRAGDRVRLFPGDVVPVDGCIVDGSGTLAPAAHHDATHDVAPGDHVAAGERVQQGTFELRAEADAASSRLARMRAHVQHAIGARDPAGRLSPALDRLLALPLTAAALVLGLTGDTARAAAMLQADPQQGLDLAVPLAREAALYALARQGLLASGLEAVERLAAARILVLQDTGVLSTGRWTVESVYTEAGGDANRVRRWLAALADTPLEVLAEASFPDLLVRQWVRHGALLNEDGQELHLASRARLLRIWGLALPEPNESQTAQGPLRRELAVVTGGRVIARVVLSSPLRPAALECLKRLSLLGFERIAVFVEGDGSGRFDAPAALPAGGRRQAVRVPDDRATRSDWLADAVSDGKPLVMVHSVLRDLLPPGSLSLTPMDAEAGSHGVLLGDPLLSLVVARETAVRVQRRLRLHQSASAAANAALMTASALRWMPPIGTAIAHHGFALLLLLDSLRIESLGAEPARLSSLQRPGDMAQHRNHTMEPRSATA